MSLYDKYHSDININYMYDLLVQILNKDIGEDISNNDAFKKIFTDNSKQIFTEVNSDVLEEINKVLLDKHILHFTNLLQLNKPKDILNDNAKKNYNQYLFLTLSSNSNKGTTNLTPFDDLAILIASSASFYSALSLSIMDIEKHLNSKKH